MDNRESPGDYGGIFILTEEGLYLDSPQSVDMPEYSLTDAYKFAQNVLEMLCMQLLV